MPGAFAQTHVANPYVGATVYVSPDYATEVAAAEAAEPSLAGQMATVAKQPTFVWLDHIAAITAVNGNGTATGRMSLQQHINAAVAQANGAEIVVQLVIYDLPQRDCAALASNGELSIAGGDVPLGGGPAMTGTGIQEYENYYITPIYNILAKAPSNVRFVLVIEDDSLPNILTNSGLSFTDAPCVAANGGVSNAGAAANWTQTATPVLNTPSTGVYYQGISYALNSFHKLPNAYNYLDIGHHGWLGWTSNTAYAVQFFSSFAQQLSAGYATIDGFITNTANYGPLTEPYIVWDEVAGGPITNTNLTSGIFTGNFYQWNPAIDELTYKTYFLQALTASTSGGYTDPRGQAHTPGGGFPSTIGFLIDTSRNGWGNTSVTNGGGTSAYQVRPTAAGTSTAIDTFVNQSKIDLRNSSGQWCNQENAGIGVLPTVNPTSGVSAYVWVKPPGEADGNYPGSVYNGVTSTVGDPNCNPVTANPQAGADTIANSIPNPPSAGTFWLTEFVQLVEDAYPVLAGSSSGGFTLTPASASETLAQGGSATDAIMVTDSGGFTGTVTLTASSSNSGVTVSVSGDTLTLNASSTATGTATISVTGISGTTSATTSIAVTVTSTGTGSFSLSRSASTLSIAQGASGTDTITVTDVSPFTGSVTLAATGLPSEVTAAFGTNPTTGSSVVTFTASSTATTGTSTVTITGTSGSLTATTTISLTVTSSTCTPTAIVSYISVNGGSTWTQESAATVSSTTTAVDLGPQPVSGGTWSWTGPNGFTSTARQINSIALSTGANVYTATYTNSSSCKSTQAFTITVTGTTPSFTLSRSASSLAVAQGSSATDTITVTDVGGFTGSVTLAATGLPSGVTVVYGTNPTTGSSVLTFTASATATAGTATVTITGTSGTLTATITINLTVSASGFTLAASPTALSVTQGKTATDSVTVTDVGGFTGSVTLAAMGLPSGVTVTYGTNPTTGTSGLTFTASATATAGTYTVTITGTSGSTTATTTIPLTVVPSTGSFTIASSPTTCTLPQGGSCTVTITITDVSPFAGSVTLSASGLPSGVTVAFGTNPTTTTSVLTFTASSTATVGTSTVTITGTSGTLTGSVTIALTVTTAGSGYAATAKANFLAMYGDMNAANGYFSPLGIPYHSVETFMVEAPDYGHETVSETYSYYIWLTAMYGAIDGNWAPLTTAWDNMQTYMIPSAAQQPTNAGYNPSAPATYCPSYDSPSGYPCQFTTATVGIDPLSAELNSAYGNPNIYAMHWILDTTNWYGYGIDESGPGTAGAPSFYNSYQRGPMESVWLTIPQPSWDIFKYGNTSDGGYLSLFTGGTYTQQWKYTDAPDADARAIQAMYWAQQWSADNSTVAALLPNASKLGDYLRYSFYDKYFKEQGCQSTSCPVENGTKNSSAYLLSWYYAWGGAVPADGSWAWRIGSSDVHFGYQNPVAAYALSTDTSLIPKGSTAKTDWTTTLQRTLEFYRWLQSSQGAIAGGATNSWGGGSNTANPPTAWGGQYAVPPAGTPTFYGMSYIFAPSYGNPPSNQWFGMQAWSMERLAEYYYISGNADAKIILDPWIAWVEANSTVSATAWSIPSTIGWSGQPALNWNASTQNWTPGTAFNAGLNVSIVNSGEDVGVTGSLCKALLYYSAGTAKYGTQDMTSFNLAKSLLQTMWTVGRDSIGVSTPETRTDYSQLTIPIYVPSGWTGTMPNGDPINSSSTFLSIRTQYETDPNYAKVAAYAAGTGSAPVFNYHRFWAQTDVATAYGAYFLLFPNN
jgi:cellulase/cellobiase CelA1